MTSILLTSSLPEGGSEHRPPFSRTCALPSGLSVRLKKEPTKSAVGRSLRLSAHGLSSVMYSKPTKDRGQFESSACYGVLPPRALSLSDVERTCPSVYKSSRKVVTYKLIKCPASPAVAGTGTAGPGQINSYPILCVYNFYVIEYMLKVLQNTPRSDLNFKFFPTKL